MGQVDDVERRPVLEMRGISKRYPGVVVLEDVGLTLYPGEVHGLVGENGAGKSTLIKILAGAIHADGGEIIIGGRRVEKPTPTEMHDRGIAVIYHRAPAAEFTGRATTALAPDTACAGACRIRPMSASDIAGA